MTYLLDTNTCIEYLNGRSRRVAERLYSRLPVEIVVCAVVKAELRYGAERSENSREAFARLEEFLDPYRSLPFNDECAKVYGQIRARLARSSRRPLVRGLGSVTDGSFPRFLAPLWGEL